MGANMPERRDIATVLADLRVSVAKIETAQVQQAESLRRLEDKLDLGIFREEYERRHKELAVEVEAVVRDYQQRMGREGVWKVVYGLALVIIGGVVSAVALRVI